MNTTAEFDRIFHNGLPHWLHRATGRLLPVVSGGDGPEGEGGGDGGEGGEGDGGGDDGKGGTQTVTMTQAELDRIIAREKAAAKRAADRDTKTFLEAEKAKADEAALSEAERAKAEAARLQREADDAKAQAARERLDARIERRLLRAGVPEEALARAMRTVDVPDDANDDDIAAEIDQLKKDLPGLFTSSDDQDGRQPKPPGTTSARGPKGGQGTTTGLQRGADRWRQKHPAKNPANTG